MRHLVVVLSILSSVAVARAGTTAPTLAPITENYQTPKMARLRELNAMLADAMKATPTAAQIDDEQAEQAAIDRMSQVAATVKQALVPSLRPNGAVAFSVVQDNLRIVESRLALVERMRAGTVALHALAAIANAHGEPSAHDLDEATGALAAMSEASGSAPALYDAMTAWRAQIDAKLAEVVWPAALAPTELSRRALAAAPIKVHGAVDGHRWKPIAILDVTAPVRELASHGDLDGVPLRIRGPVKNEAGLVVGPAHELDSWKQLDAGTYVLEAQGRGAPVAFDLALTGADTPIDRMAQVGSIAADAPLERHRLEAIYPFLDEVGPAYLRQQVFFAAPRALFVYARDDFDAHDAEADQNSTAMPRKDEPLLVTAGPNRNGLLVFDAEGFGWRVRDWSMLATAPSGAPALPAEIHDVALTYGREMLVGTATPWFATLEPGTAAPTVKQYLATIDTWSKCVDKVIQRYGGAIANDLVLVTYRDGHVQKVEGLSDKAWNEADRTCGTKAYEAKLKKLDAQLSAAHAAARAKALAAIRAQWTP